MRIFFLNKWINNLLTLMNNCTFNPNSNPSLRLRKRMLSSGLILAITTLCLMSFSLQAQVLEQYEEKVTPDGVVYIEGPFTLCELTIDEEVHGHSRVGLHDSFLADELLSGPVAKSGPSTANIFVNYTGFTPEAQIAFQRAVDIWSRFINSDAPITIDADFVSFDNPNVIGAAGANFIVRDFPGAVPGFWYGEATGNVVAGEDLIPGVSEISASFSREFSFLLWTRWKYAS